jgi:hypothetical protein
MYIPTFCFKKLRGIKSKSIYKIILMLNTVLVLHHLTPIPLTLQGKSRMPYLINTFSSRIGFADFEMDCLDPCVVFKIPPDKKNHFKNHYKFSEFIQTGSLSDKTVC